MFQLILPFQLELPFDGPEAVRSAQAGARVRRARVRGRKGRAELGLSEATTAPAAEAD